MKLESLVIADQPCRGEYVLESCTHRPSLQGNREYLKPLFCPQADKSAELRRQYAEERRIIFSALVRVKSATVRAFGL